MGNVVAVGNGRDTSRPGPPMTVAVAGAASIGVAWSLALARAGHERWLYDPAAVHGRLTRAPVASAHGLDAADLTDLLAA